MGLRAGQLFKGHGVVSRPAFAAGKGHALQADLVAGGVGIGQQDRILRAKLTARRHRQMVILMLRRFNGVAQTVVALQLHNRRFHGAAVQIEPFQLGNARAGQVVVVHGVGLQQQGASLCIVRLLILDECCQTLFRHVDRPLPYRSGISRVAALTAAAC